MAVDFVFRRSPAYQIAFLPPMTEYKETEVRAQFGRIAQWARARRYRTGKWFFLHLNKPSDDRFQVAIEVKGTVRGEGKIRTRRLPAGKVGAITFDPAKVSIRVAYFGISAWTRWERRVGHIRRVVSYREVYDGNPWADRSVSSRTTVEVVVR